jgi:phosphatidylglycerol:prolipoprotein diacylglycerol transferase
MPDREGYGMLPYFTLFGHRFSTYYTMMLAGFVFMLVLMLRRRSRYGLKAWQAVLFTVCVMFSGVLGCKVLYTLEHWGEPFTLGGFSFFGAVFLVPPLMALLGLPFRLRPGRSICAAAPCVNAMIGTIRVGCFFNGCCGGWATASGFIWPTQAAESIGDFVILWYLLRREEAGERDLYPRFMVLYGALRFVVEFFRKAEPQTLFHAGHWFAIAAIVVGLACLALGRRRKRPLQQA